MKQLIAQYFDYLNATGNYSHNTLEAYRMDIEKGFAPYLRRLGKSSASEITPLDITGYLDYVTRVQGNGEAARARKLTAIRTFCRFLVEHHIIPEDPSSSIRSPHIVKKEPLCLTDDECDRLLKSVSGKTRPYDRLRDMSIIMLILHTGLLVSELVTLKISDVNLLENKLRVTRDNKHGQWLALDRDTVRVLTEFLAFRPVHHGPRLFAGAEGGTLHRTTIYRIIKRNLKLAGIDKAKHGPHLLRHTFCMRLHRQGYSPDQIQNLAGHKSIATTMKYVRRQPSETEPEQDG